MSLMKIAEVDKSIRRERQRRSNEDEDDNEIEILSETRPQTASSTNSDEIRRRSDRILDKNLPNAMYIEKSKVDHPPQCRIRPLHKTQKKLVRKTPLDSAFLARERRLMELERQQIAKERILLEREKKLLAHEKRQAMANHNYPIVYSNPSSSDQHSKLSNTPSFSETIFSSFKQENSNVDDKQRSSGKSPTVREYLRKSMVCQKGGLSTPPALRVFKQRKQLSDQSSSIPRSINVLSNHEPRASTSVDRSTFGYQIVEDNLIEDSRNTARFIRNGCHLYRVNSDEINLSDGEKSKIRERKCSTEEDEIEVVYDSANLSSNREQKSEQFNDVTEKSNLSKQRRILIRRTSTIQPEITNIVPLNLHALLGSCQSPEVIELGDDEDKSIPIMPTISNEKVLDLNLIGGSKDAKTNIVTVEDSEDLDRQKSPLEMANILLSRGSIESN